MTDNEIFAKFKELTPYTDEDILFHITNAYNSIRVRLSDEYTELIFTYTSDTEWKLETYQSYLWSLHGE